jgi:hypothetical protein
VTQLFEKIAGRYLENNVMRHSAKEVSFRAALLFLVLEDDIGLEKHIEKSSDRDPFFNNSMEHKFLLKIMHAWRENDLEQFGHEW